MKINKQSSYTHKHYFSLGNETSLIEVEKKKTFTLQILETQIQRNVFKKSKNNGTVKEKQTNYGALQFAEEYKRSDKAWAVCWTEIANYFNIWLPEELSSMRQKCIQKMFLQDYSLII